MASIKIKNFGPIKEGYAENDGFIPIQKFMAFIGNQGSGKSSVVKLISTFSWLEKALFQEKRTEQYIIDNFINEYCASHQIQNYFQDSNVFHQGTEIEYKGEAYSFSFANKKLSISENNLKEYYLSKISFIPAERNFVSVLDDAGDRDGLPDTINWVMDEYFKARKKLKMPVVLPVNQGNEIRFWYEVSDNTAYIEGAGYKIKLSQASSGIQSATPLFIVLKYLDEFIIEQQKDPIKTSSYNSRVKFKSEINDVKIKDYTIAVKDALLEGVYKKYTLFGLLNIIEEIEQNLFPDSQRAILEAALEFTNALPDNKLILTTHSPYIIGYMTLAMKGYMLKEKIKGDQKQEAKLEEIMPIKSCINPDDVGVYELHLDGKMKKVKIELGIVSDDNDLNEALTDVNDFFDELLDIEEFANRK